MPSIFLPHDSRTSELVETMRMPHLSQDVVASCGSVADVLDRVEFDADTFDENRRSIAGAYLSAFRELGVPVSDRLLQFE